MSIDQHHENGPSRLYMRQQCSGSTKMEEGKSELPSPDAEEGTLMHNAVWDCNLRIGMNAEQLSTLERTDEFLGEFDLEGGWRSEHHMQLIDGFSILTAGTCDAVGILKSDPTIAIVPDFKFGRIGVDPAMDNIQLGTYSAMVLQNFPGVKEARAYPWQPRVAGGSSRHEWYGFTELQGLTDTIRGIIKRTKEDGLQLKAGKHCSYCRARLVCPALQFDTHALATRAPCDVAIDVDNARDVYNLVAQHEKTIKAVKAKIKAFVSGCPDYTLGNKGSGLKIQDVKGKVAITDIQEAFNLVSSWWSVEEFLAEFCTVKIGNFRSEYAKQAKAAGAVASVGEGLALFEEKMPIGRGKPNRSMVAW